MKRILLIVGLLIFSVVSWYLVIKPADYNIYFNVPTSTGHVYDELLSWSATSDLAETTHLSEQNPYSGLTQELTYKEKNYEISWQIDRLNDSITRIKAGITQPSRSVINRVLLPFMETKFETNTLAVVRDYKDFLDESIEQFRIEVQGQEEIPAKYCACTKARTTPEQKAFKMMRDYSYLSGFIASNNLTPDGNPLVAIVSFNEDKRLIEFDFCFPFIKQDSLPESPDIFFRQIEASPAIKATYKGDYRFSNKSWYRIFDYAEENGIPVEKTPLEVFYNNPNMGGNTLEWTTEIYLPVSQP